MIQLVRIRPLNEFLHKKSAFVIRKIVDPKVRHFRWHRSLTGQITTSGFVAGEILTVQYGRVTWKDLREFICRRRKSLDLGLGLENCTKKGSANCTKQKD